MSRSVGTLKVNFNVDTRSLNQGLGRATSSFKSFGSSMTRLGLGLGLAITAPLAMIGAQAIKLAADLEVAYVKIKNLAGVSQGELNKMKGGIRGMSDQFGISQIQLAGGAYAVASAGIRDAATALGIVEQAAKGSLQGFGEVEQIARSITAVLNVYGKENMTAARASQILYSTVKEGQMEISSLSSTIGRVLAPAQALGISFEEVGANLATYTRAGVNAEEAITGLRNVMSSIASPTAEFITALKRAGTSAYQLKANIREKGLAASLVELTRTTKESGQNIEDLFGNIRGLVNVLSVAGEQSDTYISIVNEMQKAFGEVEKGAADMGDTLAFKMNQAKIAVENAKMELGYELAPIVIKVTDIIRGLVGEFGKLSDEQKKFGVQLGILVAAAPLLLTAIGQISNAIAGAIKIAGAMGKLGFLTNSIMATISVASILIWTYWDEISASTKEALADLEKYVSESEVLTSILSALKKMPNRFMQEVEGTFLVAGAFKDYLTGWLTLDKAVRERGKRKLDKGWEMWTGEEPPKDYVKNIGDGLTQVASDVKDKVKEVFNFDNLTNVFDKIFSKFDEFANRFGKHTGITKDIENIQESIGGLFEWDKSAAFMDATGRSFDDWTQISAQLQSHLKSVNEEIESITDKLIKSEMGLSPISKEEETNLRNTLSLLIKVKDETAVYFNTIDKALKASDATTITLLAMGFKGLSLNMEEAIKFATEWFKLQGYNKDKEGESEFDKSLEDYNRRLTEFQNKLGDLGLNGQSDPFENIFKGLNKFSQFWEDWGREIEAVMGLMNQLGNLIGQIYNNRIAKIEESYQSEIDAINGGRMSEKKKADAIAKIEKEKNEKIAKEKRRQAIFDKALSIVDIIVGTAAAVAKAGEPILAAIAAATGAISLATAIATPIPKYAKGGIFRGRTIGEIGEYAGARHNPEVVSPLSDLKKLLGGSDVYVRGEIDGYKLAIVQQNAAQRYKRL